MCRVLLFLPNRLFTDSVKPFVVCIEVFQNSRKDRISFYLLFPEDLLEVFEHDSLDGVNDHPQCGQGLPNKLLALVPGVPDVEHDVPDDVVVEYEGSLLGQLGDELDEGTDDLEDLDRVLTRQLLHEKLEKQGRVVNQARPNDLK